MLSIFQFKSSSLQSAFLLACPLLSLPVLGQDQHSYNDCHVHVVDFMQEGEGLKALLESMNNNNIHHAMITGVGVMKKWSKDEPQKPKYYLSDGAPVYWYSATDYSLLNEYKALPEESRKRLHPFITGFNPTDLHAAKKIEQKLNTDPHVWQGIGEIFTRHDDLSALTEGEVPRANHPALKKVYKIAGKHDLPVLLHSNLTSKRDKGWLYLEELEEALKSAPDTRFILAHAGTSGTLHRWQAHEDLHQLIDELLTKYDNLWIDLSWSVLDSYIAEHKTPKIKADTGKIKKGLVPEWIELLEKYPTRFMVGSDVLGKYKSQGKLLRKFDSLFTHLKPTTGQSIAEENFLSVLPQWRQEKLND